MSCRGCAANIDCGELSVITPDFAPSQGFYATQGYTFVLDCPPGYLCFKGYWPRPITIPPPIIPPVVIGDGGNMFLLGCRSMLSVQIPVGATRAQIQALANELQRQWALQQANCDNINTSPAPGIPPPTPIPGGGGGRIPGTRVTVTNDEQCYTAHCVPESAGAPYTDCVEPGYYEQTLFNATPEQVAFLQAKFNADALALATSTAQSHLLCGTCSQEQSGSIFCPGDPSKTSHLVIPQGAHCLAAGTPQINADALALADLTNGLATMQAGLGCPCIVDNVATFSFRTNCNLCYNIVNPQTLHPIPEPNSVCFNGPIDFCAWYWGQTASCPGPCKFNPSSYIGPSFYIMCGGHAGDCH